MGIDERLVSILIPAFGRKAMTVCAVECSLATGAGEVIVSLDTDRECIEEALREKRDQRLKVVVQEKQLGLWPNHLALLRTATRPYIKFLQTDDLILPGGLRRLCNEMTPQTSIVSGLPYYLDRSKGVAWRVEAGTQPGRWTSSEYLSRAAVAGNELGRPSYTLVRRQCVPIEERYWCDDISADWLMNLAAAGLGEVAIVPHGTVVCGVHPGQEGGTQSFHLTTRRLAKTLQTLATFPDSRYRPVISVQAGAAFATIARNAIGTFLRGRLPFGGGVLQDIVQLTRLIDRSLLATTDGLQAFLRAIVSRHMRARRIPVPDPLLPPDSSA
ncbi:MAG: glycosyltransferase family 2 protein [Desulfobacteraceae bacterium]|nr:MAG: glycosyltransferase family 2 protein [Desulfobacteraceae bacterium]